jgi:hypothetical protein
VAHHARVEDDFRACRLAGDLGNGWSRHGPRDGLPKYQLMKALLIVTGALTALAGIGFVAPRLVLGIVFRTTAVDASTALLTRHWSLLIALVGGLLIYAGFHTEARVPIMIAAIVEKLALGGLVIASPLRRQTTIVAVAGADAVMALLYVISLVASA